MGPLPPLRPLPPLLLLHLSLPLLPLRLNLILIDRGIFPPIPHPPLVKRLVPLRLLIPGSGQPLRLPLRVEGELRGGGREGDSPLLLDDLHLLRPFRGD